MSYRPRVKNNACTNAHPVGCYYNVYGQMLNAIDKPIKASDGQTALVVGSSSGVGLATRIALTFAAGMDTIGVYCDRAAQPHKYGSAGWYNNQAFEYHARRANKMALSTNQDAFKKNAKDWVIQKLQQNGKKIDVLVYSLSPVKRNIKGVAEYRSAMKPIDADFHGRDLDVFTQQLKSVEIESASAEEIDATEKVMGGEGWQEWVMRLKEAGVLADNFKTIAYSYSGTEHTQAIYANGTLGAAKSHLHETAIDLDEVLSDINGHASIGLLQANITPSSAAIPSVPLYISVLRQQQELAGKSESILQQISRLFKDGVFKDEFFDDAEGEHYLRVDDLERDSEIQLAVGKVLSQLDDQNLADLLDTEKFKTEFLQQFGFAHDFINYEQKPDPLTPPAIHDFSHMSMQQAG